MKRLFLILGLLAGATSLLAKDKLTFGTVPPPSAFPDLATATNRVAPPQPTSVPNSVLNALVPLPNVRPNWPVATPQPLPVAPPVAVVPPAIKPAPPVSLPTPKPVASKPVPPEPTAMPALPKNLAGAKLITTPGGGLSGRLVMVDEARRFAVINFPLGQMPGINQTLTVFRHGVRVGEIVVTGPQRDDNIVGDVVAGEFQMGDEVRAR